MELVELIEEFKINNNKCTYLDFETSLKKYIQK